MGERRIFVAGSLNMDLQQAVPRLPLPGETIKGAELLTGCGGKGANQARAASRLGAPVVMLGKVGDDEFGRTLRDTLATDGVDVRHVYSSTKATGTAMVLLLPDGENSIVIAPGANGDLQSVDVAQGLAGIGAGDLLLCQLETPLDAVAAALKIARQRGATTMLDPAPARLLPQTMLEDVDILTPNETEAETLAPTGGIRELAKLTGGTVVVKRGSAGCVALHQQRLLSVPGFKVEVVDTTGAGDTFNGALAVALLRGLDFPEALRFANAAAAFSVTRQGAGGSSPREVELQAFWGDIQS